MYAVERRPSPASIRSLIVSRSTVSPLGFLPCTIKLVQFTTCRAYSVTGHRASKDCSRQTHPTRQRRGFGGGLQRFCDVVAKNHATATVTFGSFVQKNANVSQPT